MTKVNKEAAIAGELRKANRAHAAFEHLQNGAFYEDAVSRLYYSLLHRVKALLLTQGLEPKSHEGALRVFSEHFVKDGPLSSTDSHFFASLMKFREEADYSPSFIFTDADVKKLRDETTVLSEKILDLIRKAGFKA